MLKNDQLIDVEQMSLLELSVLQDDVMGQLMAGKITQQEAEAIVDKAEKQMRSIKRQLGAH
jgi:hypothetical protein